MLVVQQVVRSCSATSVGRSCNTSIIYRESRDLTPFLLYAGEKTWNYRQSWSVVIIGQHAIRMVYCFSAQCELVCFVLLCISYRLKESLDRQTESIEVKGG